MKNLNRIQLAENIHLCQKAYSNRSLQTGGIISVSEKRAMVEVFKKDECVKTETLIKCLNEKLQKGLRMKNE